MKSEYFVLLPNDIYMLFFAKFGSHRVNNEKVMTKTSSVKCACFNDGATFIKTNIHAI